ncbi:hypothetical protein [Methanoculleus frigidifontis]|nr:hypothetical protein [Methanoculleus sp. FWC-SCC1]
MQIRVRSIADHRTVPGRAQLQQHRDREMAVTRALMGPAVALM